MYKNGRKITKNDEVKKEKKKKKQEYIKQMESERRDKEYLKAVEEKREKRAERMEMRSKMEEDRKNNLTSERSTDHPLDDFDGKLDNSLEEDDFSRRYKDLEDSRNNVKYPDLEEERKKIEKEEPEEETFIQKTARRATDLGIIIWKGIKKARTAGTVGSFIGAFYIPILVTLFLMFFVVLPVMVIVLPAGAMVVLTDDEPDGERTEVVADKKEKKDKKKKDSSSGGGGGKIDAKTKKELVEGSKLPSTEANYVTSPYGNRYHPIEKVYKLHKGVDFASAGRNATGIDAVAYQDGEVVMKLTEAESGGFGHLIVIEHSDKYRTYYAHLNSFNVEQGDTVKAGDKIGEIGNTGGSKGAHLHFEIREKQGQDFVAIDPKNYVTHFKLEGIYNN